MSRSRRKSGGQSIRSLVLTALVFTAAFVGITAIVNREDPMTLLVMAPIFFVMMIGSMALSRRITDYFIARRAPPPAEPPPALQSTSARPDHARRRRSRRRRRGQGGQGGRPG